MTLYPNCTLAAALTLCCTALVPVGLRHPARPVLTAYAAAVQTSPTLQGNPDHPATTQGWVDTRLYFGLGPAIGAAAARGQGVSEAAWRTFLDREVTPRFPAGLSVLDVYGQWQARPGAAPERERSKLLVIDYPDTPDNAARIDAIRAAWKQRTHAQSVLKVTQPADVSF